MRILIFASKQESDVSYIKKYISSNDFIVACDGGLEKIDRLELKPDILIGDFDSASPELLDKFANVKKLKFDIDKDFTDLDLAIEYCVQKKPKEIIVFGAIGGRVDHSLLNVELLKRYTYDGANIMFCDENNEMFVTDKSVDVKKEKHYFSLIALTDECVITLKGTKFELTNRKINSFESLTISNEIINDYANLEVHSGKLLVIQAD